MNWIIGNTSSSRRLLAIQVTTTSIAMIAAGCFQQRHVPTKTHCDELRCLSHSLRHTFEKPTQSAPFYQKYDDDIASIPYFWSHGRRDSLSSSCRNSVSHASLCKTQVGFLRSPSISMIPRLHHQYTGQQANCRDST